MLPSAEVFASAAHSFDELARRLPADRWDGPGLGVWDLRSLVGHTSRSLSTVSTYLQRPAQSVAVRSAAEYYALLKRAPSAPDPAAVVERGRQAGIALGADPRQAVHALVLDVVGQVRAADDRLIETIAGGMWLSEYLPTRTFELAVHSLDIASATGLELRLPPDALGSSAALAAAIAVADDSGPDLLMALTGRRALPRGFSVV